MAAQFQPGMSAQDQQGKRVGTVEDILADKDGVARYLVIRDQGVFADDVVIPVDTASVAGDGVTLALSADQVHASPRFDPERHGASAGLVSATAQRFDRDDEQ